MQHKLTGEPLTWFMFQKTKYIYEDGKFRPLDFPVSHSFSYYLNWKGYATDMEAEATRQLYGRNRSVRNWPRPVVPSCSERKGEGRG